MGTTLSAVRARDTMFGRSEDLQRLQHMLQRGERLITLRGPGGIGKTTLASHLARTMQSEYDHVLFVDLSTQRDPQQVLPTISAHLPGKAPQPDPIRSITEFTRSATALLILDNFEQLLPAAEHIAELLASTEQLQIIVTSRAALQLHDEQEYIVEPLALPANGCVAEESAAVQLFVKRAQAGVPNFELTERNAAEISRLCAALEGVPLAIELAATRLRTYSLPDLLARLEHPLSVLKADFRDRPERLRSLRAAVEWSYDLLNDEHRQVFECCSVFQGNFTPEALAAVWGDENVLDVVEALIEQSFLQRVEGSETRWKMLQPLRELALEKLQHNEQAGTWRERHAAYYLSLLEDRARQAPGLDDDWPDEYLPDYPNKREGLAWAIEHQRAETALRYLPGMRHYWNMYGTHPEGAFLTKQALDLPAPGLEHLRLVGLGVYYTCVAWLNNLAEMEASVQERLHLSRALGNELETVRSELFLSWVDFSTGSYTRGLELSLNVMRWFEQLETERARDRLRREVYAAGVYQAAFHLLAFGEYERSLEYFNRAVAQYQEAGQGVWSRYARGMSGMSLTYLERYEEAVSAFLSIFREGTERGFSAHVKMGAGGLAMVATAVGDHPLAVQFAGFACLPRQLQGQGFFAEECRRMLRTWREAMDDAAFEAAWRAGERRTPDEIVQMAESLIPAASKQPVTTEVPSQLTPREMQVLILVVEGHPDRRIAKMLNISPGTASKHVANILGKLELRNRVELTRWAMERGLPT